MRIDETNNALISAAIECLRGKIEKARSFRYSSSSFANHVEEVIQHTYSKLEDAEASQDIDLRKELCILSWLYIDLLDNQIETFRLAERSMGDDRLPILKYVVFDANKRLNISSKPIPFFGDSFYCTGSFLYRRYQLELTPLYQIAVNVTDPVIFWVLVAHEVGHCKLSEMGIPENLKRRLIEHGFGSEKYIRRLNEILSDSLAVRIYGPAYFASFVNRFLLISDLLTVDYYPRFHFRLLLMSKILLNFWHFDTNRFVVIDERDAEREEIAFLTDDIIDVCTGVVPSVTNFEQSIKYVDDLSRIPKGRVDILYNAAWLSFLQGKKNLERISEDVFRVLKRWSANSEPSTEL